MYVCEKHKKELKFSDVLEKIQNTINYPIYPLDTRVIIKCQNLRKISEMHDRVIVATAKLLNAKLITKDKEIRESKLVEVVW